MTVWNPWHGCKKYSEGCENCYVYRRDATIGKDASVVTKTTAFYDLIKLNKAKEYKIKSGEEVYACMTSDFFIKEADGWRDEAWGMIKKRSDVNFNIITKRIERAEKCFPADWNCGYENVALGCTVENQRQADIRLPVFKKIDAVKKFIICEPLLERINLLNYLGAWTDYVSVGGESGDGARVCDYEWVLDIRDQCIKANVPFIFRQTGANFVKDGKSYKIPRHSQLQQAQKAGIDVII